MEMAWPCPLHTRALCTRRSQAGGRQQEGTAPAAPTSQEWATTCCLGPQQHLGTHSQGASRGRGAFQGVRSRRRLRQSARRVGGCLCPRQMWWPPRLLRPQPLHPQLQSRPWHLLPPRCMPAWPLSLSLQPLAQSPGTLPPLLQPHSQPLLPEQQQAARTREQEGQGLAAQQRQCLPRREWLRSRPRRALARASHRLRRSPPPHPGCSPASGSCAMTRPPTRARL